MTQTLYLTRGLPASGKSTVARSMVAKSNGTIVRIERDMLRDQLFDSRQYSAPEGSSEAEVEAFKKYLADRENTITNVQRSMVEAALSAGKSVIISDTNLRAKYAREWMALADKHKVNFETIDFDDVSVNECVERDLRRADRPNEHAVGEKVIRDMAKFLIKGKIPKLTPLESKSWEIEPYDNPKDLPGVVIVDIDGTVAKMAGRSPYEWHRVGEDSPVDAVISAVRSAAYQYDIIFMSGRDESCRYITETWLGKYVGVPFELHMRPEGDNRKDDLVKYELFNNNVRGQFHVRYVLDDRNQVVKMWRALGLPCFQVAEGNF
jgi:predicted kinase